ncbi:MFS transporter [Marinicrinis lubricantis]
MAVSMCSFFIYLNVYMLSTAIPLYVKDALHGSEQQMGLAITLWSIGVVALRLLSGRWMDRYSLNMLSVWSIAVFLLGSSLYFGAAGIGFLLVVRMLHGGSFAVASTSTSTLAMRIIPDERKGEGISYFSLFMSVSMVLGPACGIYLWDKFEKGTVLFVVSAIVSGLALLCLLLVPSSKGVITSFKTHKRGKPAWRELVEPKVLPISLAGFMLSFSYSSLTSFISSYTEELNQAGMAGWFFIVFALIMMLSRLLVGRVYDRWGAGCIVYPGVCFFAIGMLALSVERSSMVLLLSAAVLGLGHGVLFPVFQTIAVEGISRKRRGIATSTFLLLFDIGFGAGSFVLGWIAAGAGYRTMFSIAGMTVLLSAAIYFWMVRPLAVSNPKPEEEIQSIQ